MVKSSRCSRSNSAWATATPTRLLIMRSPSRRFVARLSGHTAAAVLKLYNQDGYRMARARSQAFTARSVLRVARCLGHSESLAALVFEWLPGQSLTEFINAGQMKPETLARVGAALAELHAQDPFD